MVSILLANFRLGVWLLPLLFPPFSHALVTHDMRLMPNFITQIGNIHASHGILSAQLVCLCRSCNTSKRMSFHGL